MHGDVVFEFIVDQLPELVADEAWNTSAGDRVRQPLSSIQLDA